MRREDQSVEFAGGRVLVQCEGPVGWLTLNQPERLNAVRLDMWQALPAAIEALWQDFEVRVILVRGAGDRAFVSGADIAEFDDKRFDAFSNREFTSAVSRATACLLECPTPVIAVIHGYCIGGCMVIASACDIRICAAGSKFGVPAGRLGLGYELDNFARLQSLIGKGLALEMLATARRFTAEEALQAGFVNQIVAATALEASARKMALQIVQNAPLSFAAAKLASRAAFDPSLKPLAQAAIDRCFDSDDYKEGRAAFHAKRAPSFKGR